MEVLLAIIILVLLALLGFAVLDLALTVLWYAAIGLIIGAVARLVIPGRQAMGWLATSVAGLVGAFTAGIVAETAAFGSLAGFGLSVLFAVLAIVLYAALSGRDADPVTHT